MIGRATRIRVCAAIVALIVASAAAAHTPPPSFGSDLDLRFEVAAPDRVQSLSVFTRANAFAERARIELPPPSVADELAEKLAVSAELASGPRLFTLQSKSSEWSDLGAKTWWGKENKGGPFVAPASGLVMMRERWYDVGTGTFLSPDPSGYLDSSNLYIGFAGDPVNNFDPTGECIGLDEIDCSDHAREYANLWLNPREWGGTAKRSLRFFGYELKGAALPIPRLVKTTYDIASHPVETWEA